jgi:hypothetical protein
MFKFKNLYVDEEDGELRGLDGRIGAMVAPTGGFGVHMPS